VVVHLPQEDQKLSEQTKETWDSSSSLSSGPDLK